jgi:hypothetical protein
MKLAQRKTNRISQFLPNAPTHSRTTHGKGFEHYIADKHGFPAHDQYKGKIDFPKEIVAQGNVADDLVGDWELKYYNIKTSTIIFGDVMRKIECLDKGMVLVLGLYDGTPEKLVDVLYIPLDSSKAKLTRKIVKLLKKASEYVKNRDNELDDTREFVKEINAQLDSTPFLLTNTSANPRFSESKGKWIDETRSISISIPMKKLLEMYVKS